MPNTIKRPILVNLELEDLPDSHTATRNYIEQLEHAIFETIENNSDRPAIDICTLLKLKQAVNYD